MITLTRKTKKEAKDSMFSRYPISLLAQGKGASPQARPGEREGCTSTSFAHRRGSMQLHGRFCNDGRPEHNNATADAQRDREGSAARAGPRRRSPRPHACLLTDVGRNLSSVAFPGYHRQTTRRTEARRWARPGASAGTRAGPNGACENTQPLT